MAVCEICGISWKINQGGRRLKARASSKFICFIGAGLIALYSPATDKKGALLSLIRLGNEFAPYSTTSMGTGG